MSHVQIRKSDGMAVPITDINSLEAAIKHMGGVFNRDKTKFTSWATQHGKLVGDAPLPAGVTEAQMVAGDCLHTISLPAEIKGSHSDYEIGVIASSENPGQYDLLYDYWGGHLEKFYGKRLHKLNQYYAAHSIAHQSKLRGDQVIIEETEQDDLKITIETLG